MGKNYYKILGLRQNASKEQIKAAYKQLALKHHPDKNPNNKQKAKQKFTQIAEAYSILSNDQKRQQYDQIRQNQSKASSSQKSNNKYAWKNPQFDPKFDHFKDMNENIKNFGAKAFKDIQFPIFNSSNWFQGQFGSFTFEEAQRIFEKVFSKYDKEMQKLSKGANNRGQIEYNNNQGKIKSLYENQTSINNYRPKNSSLINQKIIQRNGKKICIKKYNIVQNGKSHIEIHESII